MTKHLLYNEQQDANSLAVLKDIEFGVFDAQDRLFTLKVPFFTLPSASWPVSAQMVDIDAFMVSRTGRGRISSCVPQRSGLDAIPVRSSEGLHREAADAPRFRRRWERRACADLAA